MNKQVIFGIFANNDEEPLRYIKEECEKIKEILTRLSEYLEVNVNNSSQKHLSDYIKRNIENISIFHFSGHASNELLQTEGKDTIGKLLAKIAAKSLQLNLVFLNGCGTYPQSKYFLEAGAKAVISTSVKVGDAQAKDFSIEFYDTLVAGRTLEQAFEQAQLTIGNNPNNIQFEIKRSAQFDRSAQSKDTNIWGLYYNDESILDWKLPNATSNNQEQPYECNQYLLAILDDLCKKDTSLEKRKLKPKGAGTVPINATEQFDLITATFPWLIGAQLNLLKTPKFTKIDHLRLKQLYSTYYITSKFVCFLLLSDVCEKISQSPNPPILYDFNVDAFFAAMGDPSLDFLEQCLFVSKLFEDNNYDYFVRDLIIFLSYLKDEKQLLNESWKVLQKMSQKILQEEIPTENIYKICKATEKALAELLKNLAFLANYRIYSLRTVKVQNPRFEESLYDLHIGLLHANSVDHLKFYDHEAPIRQQKITGNHNSVVLVKKGSSFNQYLTLSPLIIDKNTFIFGENIDPYMCASKIENRYRFFPVSDNLFDIWEKERIANIFDTSITFAQYSNGNNKFEDRSNMPDHSKPTDDNSKIFEVVEQQLNRFKDFFKNGDSKS